jgi:carboxyl-terminal processing protease
MNKKLRIILFTLPVIVGVSVYTILGTRCAAALSGPEEARKDKVILELMVRALNSSHYRPVDINDEYSNKAFDLYIKRSDFRKQFFLQSDIDGLKAKHYNSLDEQVKEQRFDFFDESLNILNERIAECRERGDELLSTPFEFTVEERVELNPDKINYPSHKREQREYWRKYLKYQVLVRFVEMKKEQDKELTSEKNLDKARKSIIMEKDSAGIKVKTTKPVKSDVELEAEARKKVKKNQDDWFDRLQKLKREDRMSYYLNVVSGIYDPHTEFYPPKDKENFDINMSGQLEGIGATLQEKDGKIKITQLVPGGPAWKQGQLKAGDMIRKVAQGDKEPVDIDGMRVDDAVKLIRGKKGTEVRLTVEKPDGSIIIIPIIRDIVVLEETFAQSAIIEQNKKKFGYIKLPSFYADFTKDKSAGRTCSEDVKAELIKLKGEKVDGVMLDLRDNGGGSLFEVIKMMGLFIPQGPVVQVKTKSNGVRVYDDNDKSTMVYDGPLIILINENSASASEILAAAVQDYKRGLIVGSSTSSFGKGTVQNFFNLDDYNSGNNVDLEPLGAIKITIQKFYRVNGGSTQLKGVTPDIFLPNMYQFVENGERDLDYPMEWDQVPTASYVLWKNVPAYDNLKKNSQQRVKDNPYFNLMSEKAQQLKREKDQTEEPLSLKTFMAQKDKLDEENKRFKALEDPIKGMNVLMLTVDKKALGNDTARTARKEEMIKNLQKDPYVNESAYMLKEMK